MPRKHRTPASSLLNRENQQRSRARHREFVEDLQRRLLEHERRGVHATLEMQKVARAVAVENTALRALLASHGVSQEEIETHLASPEYPEGAAHESTSQQSSPAAGQSCTSKLPAVVCSGSGSCNRALDQPASHHPAPLPASHGPQHSPSPAVSLQPSPHIMATHLPSSPASSVRVAAVFVSADDQATLHSPREEEPDSRHRQKCADGHSRGENAVYASCANSSEADVDDSAFHMPLIDPACYCPPTPAVQQRPPEPSAVMHCEEAATILAQLRGQPYSSLARDSLGCTEMGDCFVRNTAVFQLIDEITNVLS